MRKYLTPAQLDQALAFARSKPADEAYEYYNPRACALAQIGQVLFPKSNAAAGSSFISVDNADGSWSDYSLGDMPFWQVASGNDKPESWTWGQFADRLEAAMKATA